MKERLLVMNGTKVLETEVRGSWTATKVEKAGSLKPGIYNLYNATAADETKAYIGAVIHADKGGIYQQVGKSYVKHDPAVFDKVPDIGAVHNIRYDGNKPVVSMESTTVKRGLTR